MPYLTDHHNHHHHHNQHHHHHHHNLHLHHYHHNHHLCSSSSSFIMTGKIPNSSTTQIIKLTRPKVIEHSAHCLRSTRLCDPKLIKRAATNIDFIWYRYNPYCSMIYRCRDLCTIKIMWWQFCSIQIWSTDRCIIRNTRHQFNNDHKLKSTWGTLNIIFMIEKRLTMDPDRHSPYDLNKISSFDHRKATWSNNSIETTIDTKLKKGQQRALALLCFIR